MVEVINISSDDEAEATTATRGVPVKDNKPLASSVQDEVDCDLLEVDIEGEEAVAGVEEEDTSGNVYVKDQDTSHFILFILV